MSSIQPYFLVFVFEFCMASWFSTTVKLVSDLCGSENLMCTKTSFWRVRQSIFWKHFWNVSTWSIITSLSVLKMKIIFNIENSQSWIFKIFRVCEINFFFFFAYGPAVFMNLSWSCQRSLNVHIAPKTCSYSRKDNGSGILIAESCAGISHLELPGMCIKQTDGAHFNESKCYGGMVWVL